MNKIYDLFFSFSRRRIFLVITVLMTIILVDTYLIKFYDLVNKNFIDIYEKNILFAVIVFACVFLGFNTILSGKKLIERAKLTKKSEEKFTNYVLSISYIALALTFSILIYKLFYSNYYDSLLLITIIAISLGTASFFISKTLILFISWFRLKHNLVFFLYSISMVMILFNLIITNIYVNIHIYDRPARIREHPGGSINISGDKYENLSYLFRISSILSFVSIWLTTSLLMYSSKDAIIGRIQYWVILIIPLAYFILSYFAQTILAGIIFPFLSSNPVSTALILISVFTLSKPIGGVVFGISFWRISKFVNFQKILQVCVIISGYGFLLIFSANQTSSLVLAPYPPFGIATITVLIMASYFIYTGIYRSAIMISVNTGIRNSIYQSAKESKLLNLSGRTEMEKDMTNTVNRVIKNTQVLDKTISENTEIDETELRNYVKKVIHELRKDTTA